MLAQGAGPHVVVVGGGFGGASCALALRRADPRIKVTLIGASERYFAMPFANAAIAGLVDVRHQMFGYERIKATGVDTPVGAATAIDSARKTVTIGTDGVKLDYDRLVIAPGIELQPNFVPGYDAHAASAMPAAYCDGREVVRLRAELEAMADGGTVVISAPVNPARCPPAPYERASLIAHVLKVKKPKSKVILLDAKDGFTMQKLFEAAWAEHYPGLIEWVGLSQGGALASVDARARTLMTDFEKYRADVASIIPPQKAGRAAELAGVADRTGWCPVDPATFESKLQAGIHVIGDAALAGAMPRSASAAQSQGAICARAVAAHFFGGALPTSILASSCYSLIAPDYAISQHGRYRPADGQYVEAEGGAAVSPLGAARSARKAEAVQAHDWYARITGEIFG